MPALQGGSPRVREVKQPGWGHPALVADLCLSPALGPSTELSARGWRAQKQERKSKFPGYTSADTPQAPEPEVASVRGTALPKDGGAPGAHATRGVTQSRPARLPSPVLALTCPLAPHQGKALTTSLSSPRTRGCPRGRGRAPPLASSRILQQRSFNKALDRPCETPPGKAGAPSPPSPP